MSCKDCGGETIGQSIRCLPCKKLANNLACRKSYRKHKIKKGHTIKGKQHGCYKHGQRCYMKWVKDLCEFCEVNKENLIVHHIDENRFNNEDDNLMTLCKPCHVLVHANPRDSKGRFIKKEKSNDRLY